MPSAVNAFNVKIASPGSEAMESVIAQEVIWDWNSAHALSRKQVLLPLSCEAASTGTQGDLLVAFFCASSGRVTCGKIGREVEEQLDAGQPVLVYFSEARSDLAESNAEQEAERIHLQKRYGSRAVIGSYGNEKEFRAQFTRDLETTVQAQFKIDASAPTTPTPPPFKELSECAKILLSEACEDFEAYIGRNKVGDTLRIQANGKQLVEQGNPEAAAKWECAFQELLIGAYIHDAGYNGQLFQISAKGFAFLKSIGKTPVGYIAEMGGM